MKPQEKAGMAGGNRMNTENMPEASGASIPVDSPVGQGKRLANSWFWIALLSFANLYYTVSVTTEHYYKEAAKLYDYFSAIKGFGFILAATGILLIPLLFKRFGIFDDARRFRLTFSILSATGIASIILFEIFGAMPEPDAVVLVIFQLISMTIPAITAGCALHRAVKVMSGKRAVMLSGQFVITSFALTLVLALFSILFAMIGWRRYYEFSFIAIYSVLLIIPVILLITNKDTFEYTAPMDTALFSESLYPKLMILAVIMVALDAFHDSSYYSGGNFDGYSMLFVFALMFLLSSCSCFITFMLRANKWMPIMLACVLSLCF